MHTKILITGANGFVGSHLADFLEAKGIAVMRATRAMVGEISESTNWSEALAGAEAVVHCAAAVHNPNGPIELFRRVNVEGTLALAKQAAACGVKRFVFISTVKVMGEGRETAYTEEDTPQPQGGYAISKWEAEQGLLQLAKETGLEVVILRPTLIYGERVGANFLKLMRLIKHRLPLPLGAVHNQRGLLYIGNVTDAIYHCLTKKEAAHQTFLIADSQPISTTGLIQKLGRAMQRPALLIPVPAGMCMALGALLGKKPAVQRLFGSLFVDTRRIQATLNWQPPTTMDEGLTKTAHWFMKRVQTH